MLISAAPAPPERVIDPTSEKLPGFSNFPVGSLKSSSVQAEKVKKMPNPSTSKGFFMKRNLKMIKFFPIQSKAGSVTYELPRGYSYINKSGLMFWLNSQLFQKNCSKVHLPKSISQTRKDS